MDMIDLAILAAMILIVFSQSGGSAGAGIAATVSGVANDVEGALGIPVSYSDGASYDTSYGVSLENDQDVLARTIYGEARGQTYAAQVGVGCVVRNRFNLGYLGGFAGGSYAGICKAPNQFSCWNQGDPNLAVIEAVTTGNSIFQSCTQIAAGIIAGTIPDNTGGATFYHDTSIATPAGWGEVRETAQLDDLIFFQDS